MSKSILKTLILNIFRIKLKNCMLYIACSYPSQTIFLRFNDLDLNWFRVLNKDLDFFRFLKKPGIKDLIWLGFKLKWRFLNTLLSFTYMTGVAGLTGVNRRSNVFFSNPQIFLLTSIRCSIIWIFRLKRLISAISSWVKPFRPSTNRS